METILIVDDTFCVLDLLQRVLLSEGYKVLSAFDGDQAIEIAAHWPDQINLLITDVSMPGMKCSQMVKLLRAQRPTMRVMFISGLDQHELTHAVLPPDAVLLTKPFLPKDFTKAVRHTLDSLSHSVSGNFRSSLLRPRSSVQI